MEMRIVDLIPPALLGSKMILIIVFYRRLVAGYRSKSSWNVSSSIWVPGALRLVDSSQRGEHPLAPHVFVGYAFLTSMLTTYLNWIKPINDQIVFALAFAIGLYAFLARCLMAVRDSQRTYSRTYLWAYLGSTIGLIIMSF